MDYLNRKYLGDLGSAFIEDISEPIPELTAARQAVALSPVASPTVQVAADLLMPESRFDLMAQAAALLPAGVLAKAASLPGGMRVGIGSSEKMLPRVIKAAEKEEEARRATQWAKEALSRPIPALVEYEKYVRSKPLPELWRK